LFHRLRQLRSCIILLCETHSKDDAETLAWTQEGAGPGLPWEGHAFWHHGSSLSRGVAVLVTAGLPISTPATAYQDLDGRILTVSFTSEEGFPWEVMAVYAPAEPHNRPPFFDGPFAEACAHMAPGCAKVVAGDWNCVTSLADFSSPQLHPQQNSRLVGGSELHSVQTTTGLVDVWRLLHPQDVEFTRVTHSTSTVSYGRTTRWLISHELLDESWAASCVHMPGQLPGDHAAVQLRLSPPRSPLLKRPAWVFPTSLLAVPEYLDMMDSHLQSLCAQPLPGFTAMDFWDHLKGTVRAATIAFTQERSFHRHRQRRECSMVSSIISNVSYTLHLPFHLPLPSTQRCKRCKRMMNTRCQIVQQR
jgi:exonuclease III